MSLRLTPNVPQAACEPVSAVATSVLHESLLPDELESQAFVQNLNTLCQSLGSGNCAYYVIRALRSAIDTLKSALQGKQAEARKHATRLAAVTALEIGRAECKVYQSSEKSLVLLIREDYRQLSAAVDRGELVEDTPATAIEALLVPR